MHMPAESRRARLDDPGPAPRVSSARRRGDADDACVVGVPRRRRRLEGEAPGRPRLSGLPHAGGAPALLRGGGPLNGGWRLTSIWASSRCAATRAATPGETARCRLGGAYAAPARRGCRGVVARARVARRDSLARLAEVMSSFLEAARAFGAGGAGCPRRQRRRELCAGGALRRRPGRRRHVRGGAGVPDRRAERQPTVSRAGRRAPRARRPRRPAPGARLLSAAGGRRPATAVIDCIEFNERFRCGDARPRSLSWPWSWRPPAAPTWPAGFLARFAEASNDFQLYGVLDFYLSYRAWVRGKVAAFVAADPAAGAAVRRQKREEAARNFALARSFEGRPLDAPVVIAVGGLIGTRQEHAGGRAGAEAGGAGGQLRSRPQGAGGAGADRPGRRGALRAGGRRWRVRPADGRRRHRRRSRAAASSWTRRFRPGAGATRPRSSRAIAAHASRWSRPAAPIARSCAPGSPAPARRFRLRRHRRTARRHGAQLRAVRRRRRRRRTSRSTPPRAPTRPSPWRWPRYVGSASSRRRAVRVVGPRDRAQRDGRRPSARDSTLAC